MDINFDLGLAYVPTETGHFVSERHARISEIISDYDPTLELAWIPPENREPGDQPFAVIHRPVGAPAYVVCYSDDPDERLLARVFSMDNIKNDVWSQLEYERAAYEALELKRKMEEMEEAHDLSRSILRSPKATYRHDGVVYE